VSSAAPTGDDGDRDPITGRWVAGNRAGQGNATHRRVAALRRSILDAAESRMAAVVDALFTAATQGDTVAARLLLDRALGTSRPEPADAAQIDLGPLDSPQGIAAATARLAALVASGDIDDDQADRLLRVLDAHREALALVRLDDIETRLAQLEGCDDAEP